MHHRPSGAPLAALISGAFTRWSLLLRAGLRRTLPARPGRFALGAVLTTTVVGLVLAIPVISGVGGSTPAVELDSSSVTAAPREGNSPVVMGLDGRPASSADFAGVTTSGPAPSSGPPRSASSSSSSGTAASGPAAAVESPAPDPDDAPPAGTTAAAPAGTPSTRGSTDTPAGSPSSTSSRQPTPSVTDPAPEPPAAAPAAPVAPAAPAAAPAEVSDAASPVLALVNAERAERGCDALVVDAGLASAAQAHSAAMSASGVLGLDGPVGAVAQRPNARSAVAGWLADPADSAALLDCSRTSAGIAVVDGWWTTLVA